MPAVARHPASIPGLDLQEKIGDGGASAVYRAIHRNLQRTVAVKLLQSAVDETATIPAWLRESRLMASLAHPHVVAIYDAGQADGHTYLVMEHMAGGSLRTRMIPDRPWTFTEAMPFLDCVARALEHIHAQGVLHLDLKPENILYTADGQVKITDFGLSVQHADASALLGGRHFRGTLDYCAPEYRAGLALDARYDVFSLATLAYELLTGRLPGRVYLPASRRNPRLPGALDDVLRRGLARDPAERYASVAQFRQALNSADHTTQPRISLRTVGVLAALAALVIVPLVAYNWKPTAQQPPDAPSEWPVVEAPAREKPDRLVVLYDKPEDLSLVAGEDGAELASGSGVRVERVQIQKPPRNVPAGLPLPVWPTPRPVLVIHSPHTWGFVHPLQDRLLGQKIVKHWPELLELVVPPEKNLVRVGGFDGNCLATNHGGSLWRTGDSESWNATRRITLDRPQDRWDNPALLLTNLDHTQSRKLLGCYQPLTQGPPPGAVLVLRYRARSLHGRGSLAVYAAMPVAIPEGGTGPVAGRIRDVATPVIPESGEPAANWWLYRSPAWVVPSTEWQTYLVITECPPFSTRALSRNLVIDLTATPPTATDQVWVDDVELFVWPLGNKP
jgi:serine/threonine protein kinase